MPRKPKSRGEETRTPKKNPAPIVVPRGGKHPSGGSVKRWIREVLPPPAPTAEQVPDRKAEAPEKRSAPSSGPIQRATIQLLPGRLEPVDSNIIQQEIRFVRVQAKKQVVTLGWDIGEPPEHITLNHSSVEPVHAAMIYREGSWWIENRARHEPVVLNGVILRTSDLPRLLADGDRIRLGAVVFRFRFP